jgi:hypothetical protein
VLTNCRPLYFWDDEKRSHETSETLKVAPARCREFFTFTQSAKDPAWAKMLANAAKIGQVMGRNITVGINL